MGAGIYSNDELSKNYGIDIVDHMTSMLANEMAKSIDKEILKSMGIYDRNVRRKNSIDKIFT